MKHSVVLPCHLGGTREELPGLGASLVEPGALLTALNKIPVPLSALSHVGPQAWFPAPLCHFCMSWNESFGAECSNSIPWFHIFIKVLLQPQRLQLPLCDAPELWWCLSSRMDNVVLVSSSAAWSDGLVVQPHMTEETTIDRFSCRQGFSDKWEENSARQSNKPSNPLSRICRAKWIMQKPGETMQPYSKIYKNTTLEPDNFLECKKPNAVKISILREVRDSLTSADIFS